MEVIHRNRRLFCSSAVWRRAMEDVAVNVIEVLLVVMQDAQQPMDTPSQGLRYFSVVLRFIHERNTKKAREGCTQHCLYFELRFSRPGAIGACALDGSPALLLEWRTFFFNKNKKIPNNFYSGGGPTTDSLLHTSIN